MFIAYKRLGEPCYEFSIYTTESDDLSVEFIDRQTDTFDTTAKLTAIYAIERYNLQHSVDKLEIDLGNSNLSHPDVENEKHEALLIVNEEWLSIIDVWISFKKHLMQSYIN